MAPRTQPADDSAEDGPRTDRPMSLSEHLDELRTRFMRGLLYGVAAAVFCYFYRDELTSVLLLPAEEVVARTNVQLISTDPTESFFTQMKVIIVGALFVAGPAILLEIWSFVAAGLYAQEKKGVRIYAPFSFLLFLGGAVFCHRLMLPIMLDFLIGFGHEGIRQASNITITAMPRFAQIVNLVLGMCVMMGLIFQLPIIMLFTQKLGVVTWRHYAGYARHFIMGATIVAAVLTPTGDPLSLAITMAPILILFFGGIGLCRLVEKKDDDAEEEEEVVTA